MRRAYRWLPLIPLVVLVVVTLVGGQLNTVDAHGRVVDDSTGLPASRVSITYGQRGTVSAEDGSYTLPNLPRGARLRTNAPGYQPANPSAEDTEIRLIPGSLTLQVNEEGTTDTRVPGVEVRQGTQVLTKCTAEPCGQLVITTVGIVGQKAVICAPGHEQKEIELKGVTLITTLNKQEGGACPALPSPSPSPSPSTTPVPSTSPAPSTTTVPTPSASP